MHDLDIGAGDEYVDAWPIGVLQCLPGGVNVAGVAASQGRDYGPADLLRDGLDGLEVTGGAGSKSGLDYVDSQAIELPGDVELLRGRQANACGLFAVAQCRVEYQYFFVGHGVSFLPRPSVVCVLARTIKGYGRTT